jgi:hypothetical protein
MQKHGGKERKNLRMSWSESVMPVTAAGDGGATVTKNTMQLIAISAITARGVFATSESRLIGRMNTRLLAYAKAPGILPRLLGVVNDSLHTIHWTRFTGDDLLETVP